MPQYDNTNTCVLFPNQRKESPKHPDYKGTFTDAQGVEYWADCWNNVTAKGPMLKVKIGPRKNQEPPQQTHMHEQRHAPQYDPYDNGQPPPQQGYPREDQLIWARPPGGEPVQVTTKAARELHWPICSAPQ